MVWFILTPLLSLISIGVIYNFVPLSWYEFFPSNQLGSTITTIQATDTLKDSRAVINTNFSNLNTDKLESGSTAASLTITTANVTTLNLTNALAVSGGGTASTSLASNLIILGNGTSGFKTVNSAGTSGQVLVSQSGGAPLWSWGIGTSTSQTGTFGIQNNLNVSGALHTAGLVATGTVQFNKINYTWPSSQGAANSVLTNDGSGGLSWGSMNLSSERVFATTTTKINLQSASTTRITWGAEIFDPNNRLDANGRFRPGEDGAYLIEGQIGFFPDAGMTSYQIYVYKNQKEMFRISPVSVNFTGAFTIPYVFILQLTTVDTIEIWATATDGGPTPGYCSTNTNSCSLHIQKLHD